MGALSRRQRSKRSRGSAEGREGGFGEVLNECLELNAFRVRSNLDSGAAVSVAPPDAFPGYPIKPSSEGNLQLVAANGEAVRHYGEVHPMVIAEEGHFRTMKFQVADVNKVLTSAAQVANQGYKITMDHQNEESFFQDKELGDRFTLHQEDGIYVHYLNVLPYRPAMDEGFHGQSSRASSVREPET